MPDHAHALVSFPPEEEMSRVIGSWKRFTARTAAVQWQRNFFDHRLRADESVDEKLEYILQNPVRAGLIESGEQWPFLWQP